MNLTCGICQRGGCSSKTALNRHHKTHNLEGEHICNVCGLAFYRKDVLVRHCRNLHEGTNNSSSDGRKRSQRACDRCRSSKAKCDGIDPCASCLRRGHKCSYQQRVNRLSQRHRNIFNLQLTPARHSTALQNDTVAEVNTSVPSSSIILPSGKCSEDLVHAPIITKRV